MDDTLKRLLDTEMQAEFLVRKAEDERESLIQAAMMEARANEDRFEAHIPDLHQVYVEKAEARAEQAIAEIKRRYEERHIQLRGLAEEREDEALNTAFALLIGYEE